MSIRKQIKQCICDLGFKAIFLGGGGGGGGGLF